MKKIIKKILKNFDKKILTRFSILIILVFILIILFTKSSITLSKYESSATLNVSPVVAFYITDIGTVTESIHLSDVVPDNQTYFYNFTISNFKNNSISEVDIVYSIELISTTNLPLQYDLFEYGNNTNIITSSSTITDSNGVYFKKNISTNTYKFNYGTQETDTFTLAVTFPSTYKDQPNTYAGVIELIDIVVRAEQEVNEV